MKRFASDRVTGLMERLGLDDDVAIESRLVSRTIESAQSRVEGFNFDIRKRVVEYDDVINKQRETIYAERDKVLHNEDLTETVQIFLDDEVDALVESHLVGEDPGEWNLEGLSSALAAMGLTGEGTSADDLWELHGRDAIAEHIRDLADEHLAAKQAEVGEEDWKTVERLVLIRTIDSLWVEHLTELDDMRRGIGLRGYAQQDPLNEFKREAFQLYDELRGLIRHGVASSIFRVTVTRQPARHGVAIRPWPPRSPGERQRSTGGNGANGRAGLPARPARPVASRPMRVSRRLPPPEGLPSCAAARRRHPPLDRCAPRSAISRSPPTVSVRLPAAAGRSPGSRPVAHGSGATIRAGAVPARSTRSVTGAEPGAARARPTIHVEAPIAPARPADGRAPRLPRHRARRRIRDVPGLDPGRAR